MIEEFQTEEEARARRNQLLADTDWTVLYATEKGEDVADHWVNYRQELRDIPSTCLTFPSMIRFPQKPE